MDIAHQTPLSMEFSRQGYWSRLPFSSPGYLPDPGIKPKSLALAGRFFTTGEAHRWHTQMNFLMSISPSISPQHSNTHTINPSFLWLPHSSWSAEMWKRLDCTEWWFSPRDAWHCLETFLVVACTLWVEAMMLLNTLQRMDPQQSIIQTKMSLILRLRDSDVENVIKESH